MATYDNYATDSNEFHHGFIYFETLHRKVKPSRRSEAYLKHLINQQGNHPKSDMLAQRQWYGQSH